MTNAYASSILHKTLCRDSQFNKQNHHPMKRRNCICTVSAFLLFLGLFAPQAAWGDSNQRAFSFDYGGKTYYTDYLTVAVYYADNNSTITVRNSTGYLSGSNPSYYSSGGNPYSTTVKNGLIRNKAITIQSDGNEKYTVTRNYANYCIDFNNSSSASLTINRVIFDGGNVASTYPIIGFDEESGSGNKSITINDCVFRNCNRYGASAGGNGGAISVSLKGFTSTSGTLVCNNVDFYNNIYTRRHESYIKETYGGGAISINYGVECDLAGCEFYDNFAVEGGGAIFLGFVGNCTIDNCIIGKEDHPNQSSAIGGGIYCVVKENKTVTIKGNTKIEYNQVITTPSAYGPPINSHGYGGGIIIGNESQGHVEIGDGEEGKTVTISNNYARGGAGGLAFWCGTHGDASFSMHDFVMENNRSGNISTSGTGGGAAAFHGITGTSNHHTHSCISIRDGEVRNNHSDEVGGGGFLFGDHGAEVINVSFENNYTEGTDSNGGAVAVYAADGYGDYSLELIGCTFTGNGIHSETTTTKLGGAIFAMDKAEVRVLGCTIGGSSANANKATEHGGGIYIGSNAYLTMDSQVATGTYKTMEVSYNEAGNDGGGIYVANGSQGHTNIGSNSNDSYPVKINNNEAAFNGGGIALHCSGTANDLFTLRNFELKSNRALQGGGAYLQGGHISGENHGAMTISNGTVQDNHAASAGGGIYFDEHDANVSNVDFIHNTTNKGTTSSNTGAGGGVLIAGHSNHAVADHDHDFTNCTFTQNEASFGGAAMIMRKTTAKFINCTIGGSVDNSVANKNTASINGGGVYVEELSKADFINGTKVSYNEAVNGGGVYVNGFIETGGSNKLSIDCGASINVYPYEQMGEYFGIYTKNESGVYELVAGTDMSLTGSTSSVINVSNLQAETNYYVRTKLLGSYITDDYSWYYQIQCELSGVVGKIRVYDNEWASYIEYTEPYYWYKEKQTRLYGKAHGVEELGTDTYFYDIIHFRVVPDGASETKSGVVSIENGSSVQNNIASNKGGGVYKLGTLQVEGLVTITDNKAGATQEVNNVYIPTNSADGQTILITGELACGSSIGVTKTKTDHTYDDDDNFNQVRTAIAKNEVNNSGHALTAFNRNVFFDDTDKYGVWCMNYQKGGNLSDPKAYSVENDYFIETWRNFAATSFASANQIKTPEEFALFAKQVNTGNAYSGINVIQVADIDLAGHYWEPIGFSTGSTCDPVTDYKFSGNFDGQGHLIRNAISILPAKTMGLFGNVDGGSVIHTFNIGADFTGTFDGETHIGGIAGQVTGSSPLIDRCEAQGSMQRYGDGIANTGGIAGNVASGEVRNSFAVASTLSGSTVGGLVGKNAGSVKNAYAVNNTLPGSGTVGALVGNNTGTLSNAYTDASSGNVVGSGSGTYVYSAGATGATATYTPTIGADQLGYMYADNLVSGGDYDKKPLFEALTMRAEVLNGNDATTAESAPGYRTYDRWARPALAYYVDNNGTVEIEKPINGDLPVLMMDNYGDGTDGKVGRGGFTALSTVTEPEVIGIEGGPEPHDAYLIGDGYVLQYSGPKRDFSAYDNDPSYNDSEIDGMIARSHPGSLSNSPLDCHFVYGDVSKAPTLDIKANRISIYEHAAITKAGTLGSFDKTHVSITFDNSSTGNGTSTLNINDLPAQFLPRNWHLLSTPLNNAPIGFNYYLADGTTNTNVATGWTSGDNGSYANNPWQNGGTAEPGSHGGTEFGWLGAGNNRYWMKGWANSQSLNDNYPDNQGGYTSINLDNVNIGWTDGYFPSTFDATLHDFNQGCIQTADENGRYPYGMDFYSWTEPNYHYINFKRNGPNHWHSDPNANGEHEHLGYKPEKASNYASPQENVNEEILLAGKGYFASIGWKTLLQSSGQLGTNTNKTIEVTCSTYPNTVPLETGWNLVGNPFHAYLDFDKFAKTTAEYTSPNNEKISDNTYIVYNADGFGSHEDGDYGDGFSYYVASGSNNGAYASRYLHPHQGFFVKMGSNETLTFSEDMTVLRKDIGTSDGFYRGGDERPAYPLVNLFLSSAKGCSDVCVVEFNRPEWGGATKLRDMYSGNGLFYAAHDNGNYAALFAMPEAERIPLKFEAKDEAGDTYTIHWNTQNGDFHKLYLVDNITGVQYDMLRNSSYSFSGKKDDYWTRFYITFDVTGIEEEEEEDDDTTGTASTSFAFFDGSQWVVTNDGHGTATLDLIDLQGRVLHSTTLAEGQARIGLPDVAKGMYLMRLSNNKGTQVQKVIVR